MTADDERVPLADAEGHFDLDTLAEVDAGGYDTAVTARVTAHTAQCPRCSTLAQSLSAVRLQLADLPVPAMPESVAARLDAALAAEREARFAVPAGHGTHFGPQPGGHVPDPPLVADLDAHRTRRASRARWIGVAAAAAVVLAGASVTYGLTSGDNKGNGVAESTADQGSNDSDDSAGSDKGQAGGSGGAEPRPSEQGPEGPGSRTDGDGGPAAAPTTTLPTYTKSTLPGSLNNILVTAVCEDTGLCDPTQAGAMADQGLRSRCTSALHAQGVRGDPKAVQYAMFEGQKAYVFVFSKERAVVVSESCGQGGDADVLFGD